LFSGAQAIGNSIITQSGTTINIAGDLTLTTDLTVANGGTGAGSFLANGIIYGNGTSALGVTAAGTSGQVLVAGAAGVPAFVSFSGDVAVTNTGATTIQANSVALGTDTTGNYVANLGTMTGLTVGSNTGEGSTPTLSVNYGSVANTAVQGNVTLTCPSGSGNLSGGGTSITLGTGGTCGALSTVNNPTFSTSVTTPSMILTGAGSNGTIQVGTLGQGTVYTLPDPGGASATICLSTGNCSTAGTAGGDLTGTYPNPTIAKLQNTNLTITTPTAGQMLVYNGTSTRWENRAISSDLVISETGVATIQANAVVLGTDTTGNYVSGLSAGTGTTVSGTAGEGWSPAVNITYGSTANTSVQGNTTLTVTAGTNLSGGGAVTLGAGGTVTLNVASSPTFSGTLAVQGATVTVGGAAQQGSVVLNDGSANTGTIQTAALNQNTTFTLPDPGGASATICLSTGNCAGSGSGVTTAGGTTNRVTKFTGAQAVGDSSISDTGGLVTLNGAVNLVVQGGTSTLGTTTQAGTLSLSDGSSNTISIVASGTAADRTYTLPDVGANATFCLNTGNCIGGAGGSAPADATYLVATLNGNLSNERALAAGTNISITDGGANANMTVATVNNPTFSASVTTPTLQSSGALTISSGTGIIAIDATTTIELQDSTNVTGNMDISGTFTSGTADAFTINSAGAITAATGVTSSGTITFSGLNCSGNANGGALTANASGVVSCSDDDGGAGGTITGSGTTNRLALFSGASAIGDSIVTQSGTTINIAGDLTLTTDLTVANGGTGASSFLANGIIYGNGSSALGVTAAGTSGQVLVAGAAGVPAFVSFSGDVAVTNTGATTIQANSVALGTDTVGNYVATLGTMTGLTVGSNTGEGSTPTLSVNYGSIANTAVQGSTTLTCPSGTGNLSGGGTSITLGTGGTCGALNTVASPTFTGTVTVQGASTTIGGNSVAGNLILSDGAVSSRTGTFKVATLGQNTTYTLPDPGVATASICLSTGNCAAIGTAGGDLTGSYPNPTIAKLQGSNLTITSPVAGNVLVYNNTAGRWENRAISGDIAISETGVATVQADSVALGTDTTGNYVIGLTAGNGISISGSAAEGWSPTVTVVYGSSTNTAVQGNTSLTVTAGTNLSGGGTVTLGSGGSVTLNVASSPTFSGTLTVQGATATVGGAAQQGSLVLNDGSANTGTLQTAALATNQTYTLPATGGTLCVQGSTACSFAPTTGGTGYIQNQSAAQQSSSSFWVSGTSRIDGGLTTNNVTAFSGALILQGSAGTVSFGGSDTVTANGAFTLQSGTTSDLAVQSNGVNSTLNLGVNTFNKTVNIGAVGVTANTTAINIGTSTGAAQTISIGSNNTGSSTTITGNTSGVTTTPAILLQTNGATAGAVVRSNTNSTNAFQVQNAAQANMLNVNTVSNVITVNGGNAGALTAWTQQANSLSAASSFNGSVVANGYIYSFGGYASGHTTTVQYAALKSNGTTGTWATTTGLPLARGYIVSSVATYNNYIYVVGGTSDNLNGTTTVYYAKINADGTISAWDTTTPLLAARVGTAVTIANGFIYAVGGGTTTSAPSNTVYYAPINSEGSIGSWTSDATVVPVSHHAASVIVANGRIYYLGGANSAGTSQTSIYHAALDASNGDVGSWTLSGSALPAITSNSSANLYNGYVYVMNGGLNQYYYAPIASTGVIGTWSSAISMSPMTARTGSVTSQFNGYFYTIGGFLGGVGQTSVYSASAARTQISGALDLVGTTDGIVAGDGTVGGSLTVGDANIVGKLNVQSSANFSQNASVRGHLSVGGTIGIQDSVAGVNVTLSANDLIFTREGLPSYIYNSGTAAGTALKLGTGDLSAGSEGIYIEDDNVSINTSSNYTGYSLSVYNTAAAVVAVDRSNDGGLQGFFSNGVLAGTISVSGGAVAYGAFTGVHNAMIESGTMERGTVASLTGNVQYNEGSSEPVYGVKPSQIANDPNVLGAYVSRIEPEKPFALKDNPEQIAAAGNGEVWIADNGTGNVIIGDQIISSDIPGHAQRDPKTYSISHVFAKSAQNIDWSTVTQTVNGVKVVKVSVLFSFYDADNRNSLQNQDIYGANATLTGIVNVKDLNVSGNTKLANLTVTGDASIEGNLTVTGDTTVENILVNGKIMTNGTAPTVTAEAAAGTDAVVSVTGNDVAGRVTITTGAAPTADALAKLAFAIAYSNGTPQVVVTPLGKGSAGIQSYIDTVTADGFIIGANQAPAPHTTYIFTYHVVGTTAP
jgi:hypothetical protein